MAHTPNLSDYELRLDGHAHAIGHVCIAWSHMESMLDLLIADLLAARTTRHDALQASECVTANADLKHKLQIAVSLGHLRRPHDEWFEKLRKCLDDIHNRLSSERNRFVHDVWAIHDPIPTRIHRRTKITKPQTFQPSELSLADLVPVSSDEIWKLHSSIKDAISLIILLRINFRRPSAVPWP
jgi:hypothetical protein